MEQTSSRSGDGGILVTVILPCRNEAAHVEQCLRSILSQMEPAGGMELLVVDGMSTDGTQEIVSRMASRDPRVRLVENPGRIVSKGMNVAIGVARGRIIVRMDAHTEYAPDYVVECVRTLEATRADNVGGPARTKAESPMEMAVAAAYHSPFAVGGARFHNDSFEGYLDTVTYGCWLKESFDRFGLFDEDLVRNQDDEHNLRITRGGGKVYQSPRIRSWYRPRGTLSALFRQYMQYGYWKVRVIQKHRLPASWRHLVPGTFVFLLIFTAALLILSTGVRALPLLQGGSPLESAFRWIQTGAGVSLGIMALAYAAAVVLASWITSRSGGIGMFGRLLLVFPSYHISYGWGFLKGVVDFLILNKGPGSWAQTLTRGRS